MIIDTELVSIQKTNRHLQQELEELKRSFKETEDCCNDIVQRTTETAIEDREMLKKIRDEKAKNDITNRREKQEREFEQKKTERVLETLSEELRNKTLRTAMRALNRMKKYSIWKAFAKLKSQVQCDNTVNTISLKYDTLKNENSLMKQKMNNMINDSLNLKKEKLNYEKSQQNMISIISWLLDMNNGMLDDEQSKIFLNELRDVYQNVQLNDLNNDLLLNDANNNDVLRVNEVGKQKSGV